MKEYRIAIDIGGTKIMYGLFNDNHEVIYRMRTLTPKDVTQQELTDKIHKEVMELLDKNNLTLDNIRGIGMGMPSYVDYDRGVVVTSGSMYNIKNYPAKELFTNRFPGVDILIDNDANLAALAEHRLGAGRGHKHMIYAALSTGLGCGYIINNELFRGTYGGAGESGHMLVTPGEGVLCGCGNRGCIMSYASGTMIMKHICHAIENGEPTVMKDMEDDIRKLSTVHLSKAYAMGDALAIRMIDQMVHYIGIYIYNLFISFNIGCFVCGGGLTNMGDFFMDKIREKVAFFNKQEDQEIEIKVAELGGDNGIIGAAMLFE